MRSITIVFFVLAASALVFAQSDIRKIDFKNFTYQPEFCGGESKSRLTVKDGEFAEEKEVDGYTDRTYFSVFGFAYGDLDGDGKEEAVVISLCNTGGTGNFTEAYIYTIRDGAPFKLVTLEGGDRADGGIREAKIENGLLSVDTNDPGEFGGACCPEIVVTRTYKLKGRELAETGQIKKRELYPAQRIEFARGESSARVEVKLEADPGIKRFVVGASKGQRLTVVSGSENLRFRLVRGDADVQEEDLKLVADLNQTGDFIFEIRSFAEQDVDTSITITIR
jgi:hypothetical protein